MIATIRPLAALLLVAPAPAQGEAADPRKAEADAARRAAEASNRFGLDLYRRVAAARGNLCFSPYSISCALAMARLGARGKTAAQMDAVLHTKGVDVLEAHPKLSRLLRSEVQVANALWGGEGSPFEPAFLAGLEQKFGAPLRRVDFARPEVARREINGWVAAQTRQRIKAIVPPGLPDPRTLLVLGNAVYFKASWGKEFPAGGTRVQAFAHGAASMRTPMMHRVDHLPFVATDELKAVSIGFDGGDTAMLVVLPERRDGLAAVEAQLTAERLAGWRGRMRVRRVSLKLPRFRFEFALDLARTLPGMGMSDVFDPGRADLTGMSGQKPLYVGAALHRAFVDVHEKGVEAVAATVVGPTTGAHHGEPVELVADHPFAFFIVHEPTGCILFAGRVHVPRAAE